MEKILNKEEIKCSTCGGGRDDNPFCSNGFHITPKEKMAKNNCIICDKPIDDHLRCPVCGYSKCDNLIHWDHHLCKGKIPEESTDCQLPDADKEG